VTAAYLDRAALLVTPPVLRLLGLAPGLEMEADPGSNCPGRVFCSGCPAPAFRFIAFCSALAFARSRAFALVIFSSSF